MKMPNFRLYDTQATTAMLAALVGLVFILALTVVVFKGIDTKQWVIPYNEKAGMSQYRKPLVFAVGPLCILLGAVGGIMGFRSLGQARNTKNGRSWLGMTLGALVLALAPVLMGAWIQLSEPVIVAPRGGQQAASVAP